MTNGKFRYSANGLTIASTIELPELTPTHNAPQITIDLGDTPSHLENPLGRGATFQAKPGEFLLRLPGIARYWVRNGKQVTITPDAKATEQDVRVFLLSSVMGVLAYQNGFFPLHASAVAIDGRAVVFCGRSGAGKSTMAAAFHHRGHRLLADDLCVTDISGATPMVQPGYRHLKLWPDTLGRFDEMFPDRRPLRSGMKKFLVLTQAASNRDAVPLHCIYMLSTSVNDQMHLRSVHGIEKLEAVRSRSYRRRAIEGLGLRNEHFQRCGELSARTQVRVVERTRDFSQLDTLVRKLEASLEIEPAEV